MAHDVFISYSNQDKTIADAVCATLEMANIRCWIAPRDILSGEIWPEAIGRAISTSRIMVLIFSSNSNNSQDVANELILAVKSKVIVVPLKIDDIEPKGVLQYYLAGTHWLDALSPPTEKNLRELTDIIILFLNRYKNDIDDYDRNKSNITGLRKKADLSNTTKTSGDNNSAATKPVMDEKSPEYFGRTKQIKMLVKNYLLWFIILIFMATSLLFVANIIGSFDKPVDLSNEYEIESYLIGNTVGNTVNGGFVAANEEWILYSNLNNNGYLYKARKDGSEKVQINSDVSWFINVVGDWVYYSNKSEGGRIYKVRTDGSSRTKINSDESWSVKVVGDWIYYRNYDRNQSIYKIRIDGSERTKINSDEAWALNVTDGWLFYRNGSDSGKLYKVRTDGSGHTKISDNVAWAINVIEGWIYYSNYDDNRRIYKIRNDGSDSAMINTDDSIYLNVDGDWIYYSNLNDGGKIYKIRTDGSNRSRVNDDKSRYINIIGEWIYYQNKDDEGKLYRIKTDGSGRQVVK